MDHRTGEGVLVLGSTGFIGSHLVDRLSAQGHQVYALARSEMPSDIDGIRHVRGSIDDGELLRSVVARCSHIVHVASLTTPSASATEPDLEVTGNLGALAQLLSLANEFPGRRLIYMSSAGAVYGDLAIDVDESSTLRPRSYYGAGKAAAEAFVHACTATTSWEAVILRASNIYGPGQLAGKGFAIIPTLLSRAAEGGAFTIWGDGKVVRDYCHVTDLIDLTMKAVEHDHCPRFSVHNAASGATVSVLELIAACERVTGRKIKVAFEPARSVDVPHVSFNTDSAHALYQWKAKIPLYEGLGQTWRWFIESQGHDR